MDSASPSKGINSKIQPLHAFCTDWDARSGFTWDKMIAKWDPGSSNLASVWKSKSTSKFLELSEPPLFQSMLYFGEIPGSSFYWRYWPTFMLNPLRTRIQTVKELGHFLFVCANRGQWGKLPSQISFLWEVNWLHSYKLTPPVKWREIKKKI